MRLSFPTPTTIGTKLVVEIKALNVLKGYIILSGSSPPWAIKISRMKERTYKRSGYLGKVI